MEPYDAAYVPAPAGFRNTGAICWLNSLMQSLLSCPSFTRAVLRADQELGRTKLGSILYALTRDSLNNSATTHYTGQLRAAIVEQKHFGYGQECAAEGPHADDGRHQVSDGDGRAHIPLPRGPRLFSVQGRGGRLQQGEPGPRDPHVPLRRHFGLHGLSEAAGGRARPLAFQCDCGKMQSRVYRLTMLPEVVVVQFNKFYGKKLLPFPEQFTVDGTSGKK